MTWEGVEHWESRVEKHIGLAKYVLYSSIKGIVCTAKSYFLVVQSVHLLASLHDPVQTEVYDIVQETGIKTIPMEKKCKIAKWLSGEALQIAEKRREAKRKEKRKDTSI